MSLAKNFLKISLVLSLLCLRLTAQSNELNFYKDSYAVAWDSLGTPYFNSAGHLCFKNVKVVSARLLIFKDLFMPHPFNCRYEHDMFEMEARAEDYRIRLHNAEAKLSNRRKRVIGFTIGGLAVGVTGGFILGAVVFK